MDDLTLIGLAITWLTLLVLTINMAIDRGRNGFGWMILALFISPILTTVVLLCIGETTKQRWKRIEEEELIRIRAWEKHRQYEQPTEQPRTTNPTGKTINDQYHERYMPPEDK